MRRARNRAGRAGTAGRPGLAGSGGPGAARGDQRAVPALQAALAAEQAATYGYGIVGSHLTRSASHFGAASADCVAHERARDGLVAMITALGATPRPAAVAYRMPVTVSSAADAVSLAVLLERQVEASYLGLVALTDAGMRSFGARQMAAAAVRCARWSGRCQAFPGLPPSAAR